jgi:hypothetical protein
MFHKANEIASTVDLRHAQEQIALASQYPGRQRRSPGAQVIPIGMGKR